VDLEGARSQVWVGATRFMPPEGSILNGRVASSFAKVASCLSDVSF
jgi:hypothetical protein